MGRIVFLLVFGLGMGLATLTAALPLRVAAAAPGDFRAEAMAAPARGAAGHAIEAPVVR